MATINGFGTYLTSIVLGQYLGKGIKLSAYVKTTNVADYVGLWMRVDAGNQSLRFDNIMGSRPITGTTDWEQHEIVLDVPEGSTAIYFGILLKGISTIAFKDSLNGLAGSSLYPYSKIGNKLVKTTDGG